MPVVRIEHAVPQACTCTLSAERGAVTAVRVMEAAPGAGRRRAIEAWRAAIRAAFHRHRPAVAVLPAGAGIE